MRQSKNPKWVKGTRDSCASEPVIHSYRISNTLAINQVYKVSTSLCCQRVVTQTNSSCAMYKNCSENVLIWVHFLFSAALSKSRQTYKVEIYIYFFLSNIHSMYNLQLSRYNDHDQCEITVLSVCSIQFYCWATFAAHVDFSFSGATWVILLLRCTSCLRPRLRWFWTFRFTYLCYLAIAFRVLSFVIFHGWRKLMQSERRRLRSRPKKNC